MTIRGGCQKEVRPKAKGAGAKGGYDDDDDVLNFVSDPTASGSYADGIVSKIMYSGCLGVIGSQTP